MNKEGVRECICNTVYILKDLLHNMDKDLVGKYAGNIKLLENNTVAMKKLLDLGKGGEDKK